MLTGTVEVLQDDEIRQEIWRTGYTMYYKGRIRRLTRAYADG